MILGFPTTKHTLSRALSYEGVPTSHLLLINLFTEFHHPYRLYILHDDIPHILLYILIWLMSRFPNVKYANTKHGGAGGIILWALLTVFLVYPSMFKKWTMFSKQSKALLPESRKEYIVKNLSLVLDFSQYLLCRISSPRIRSYW